MEKECPAPLFLHSQGRRANPANWIHRSSSSSPPAPFFTDLHRRNATASTAEKGSGEKARLPPRKNP